MNEKAENTVHRHYYQEGMKKIKIELHDYSHECADGCCTDYGTIVKVDGVEMPYINQDTCTILEQVLNHLGYEVEVIETFDFD